MIMKPTPFESGDRSPAEFFRRPEDARVDTRHYWKVPTACRESRREVLVKACDRFGRERVAEYVERPNKDIGGWLSRRNPMPGKYVLILEKMLEEEEVSA